MNFIDEQTRREYFKGPYADLWQELSRCHGYGAAKEMLSRMILALSPPNSLILDCCAGNGYPYAVHLSRERRVVCCDISLRAMRACRMNLHNQGREANVLAGEAGVLPFREHSFDVVLCLRSTWFFSDFERCFLDLARLLRPGGVLVMEIMNGMSPTILLPFLKEWWNERTVPYRPMFLPVLYRLIQKVKGNQSFLSGSDLRVYGRVLPPVAYLREEHVVVVVQRPPLRSMPSARRAPA